MSEYHSIKEDVLKKLQANLPEIRSRFGIETIGIFGSVARGEDTPESDVDILYKFAYDDEVTTDQFLSFAAYLENLFGRRTDLISIDYIDPYIKAYVKRDAILYTPQEAAA